MFPEMRRYKQSLPEADCRKILQTGSHGVLAVLADNGYPYTVPLSYAAAAEKIWFHCALEGTKTEALRRCDKASFCVVAQDEVIPEIYTTAYKSVIVFGHIRFLSDPEEKRYAIDQFARKYFPEDTPAHRWAAIEKSLDRTCMLEMRIVHMTGKQAKTLLNRTD